VCNHPDLFERADVTAPFAFCDFPRTASFLRETEYLFYPDSATNPISLPLPRLLYEDGAIHGVPAENSLGTDTNRLANLMNIWRSDSIQSSLSHTGKLGGQMIPSMLSLVISL
jgi:chromatin-remodeling ATPase INO80